MRKKLTPLPEPRADRFSFDHALSRLDGVDPARRAKVFIWRKVGPARRVTLSSQKDPSSRANFLFLM